MIVIATPSRDKVEATFTYDLVQLIQNTKDVVFAVSLGTYLQNLRTSLVKQAVLSGATHILFIDSDMRFPNDTVERLLKHNKDIVGANCRQRTQNEWTARKDDKFISSDNKTGLEEVDTLGFGVTLIKLDVFGEQPWFAMPFHEEKFIGEDVFFSHYAKEKGFKIWIDHDLSQEIKHTGIKEF